MSYPLVRISNSTNHRVTGTVVYAACSDDDYTVEPHKTWQASKRGVCLLTRITAKVEVDGEVVDAVPYTRSGTSYSKFLIAFVDGQYVVSRVVSLPEDNEEPANKLMSHRPF